MLAKAPHERFFRLTTHDVNPDFKAEVLLRLQYKIVSVSPQPITPAEADLLFRVGLGTPVPGTAPCAEEGVHSSSGASHTSHPAAPTVPPGTRLAF